MKKRSSLFNINADYHLSIAYKILWFLCNAVNNNLYTNKTSGLKIETFSPVLSESDINEVGRYSSPSQTLADLFLLKLDWNAIQKELGRIHIFDTGCGDAENALKLQRYSNARIDKYHGVDLSYNGNWDLLKRKHKYIQVECQSCDNIFDVISENTNMFFSHSAIEHFEYDLVYFQQLSEYIKNKKANTIQIHLFPSKACLRLHLLHGFRQYVPRTISKITSLFNTDYSYSVLFKLGGERCIRLHSQIAEKALYLTRKRVGLREKKSKEYVKLLIKAIKHDMKQDSSNPIFYALVIHSNYNKRIFEWMENLTRGLN
jgi:hypothetical protein